MVSYRHRLRLGLLDGDVYVVWRFFYKVLFIIELLEGNAFTICVIQHYIFLNISLISNGPCRVGPICDNFGNEFVMNE